MRQYAGAQSHVWLQLAIGEINAKGGILGRSVELVVEDSTSGDAGTAMLKARKLIDADKVDFLLGNVNSALSVAMAEVSNEKKILHVVPGGHTDAVTGASCHWNVFRVCNTTQMEAAAITSTLIKTYGKKFYYITLDYAFGHTLEAAMVKGRGVRRFSHRRRLVAARHGRFFLLPHRRRSGQPRRHRLPARRRRHG